MVCKIKSNGGEKEAEAPYLVLELHLITYTLSYVYTL